MEYISATEITKKILETKNSSFKKRKSNNFKKSLNGSRKKSVSIDPFGNPYRATIESKKTKIISVTLPDDLLKKVDNFCKKKKVARSRFLTEMVKYCFNIEEEEEEEKEEN